MKYVANPVEADAFVIMEVFPEQDQGDHSRVLRLDNGELVSADKHMMSRMTPAVGDYWVIQSDGYVYLNPKDVFERKYSPIVTTYKDRVRAELRDLTEKRTKLAKFINDSMEKLTVSRAEQELLRRQLSAMYEYEEILQKRIGFF